MLPVTQIRVCILTHCLALLCMGVFQSQYAALAYCSSSHMLPQFLTSLRCAVTTDECSAKSMLQCDLEVSWVSWRSIWSCCHCSYSCIIARQRHTRSNTLLAPSALVRCQGVDTSSPWGATGAAARSIQSSYKWVVQASSNITAKTFCIECKNKQTQFSLWPVQSACICKADIIIVYTCGHNNKQLSFQQQVLQAAVQCI